MPLAASAIYQRRGAPRAGQYGAPVAPGEKVFRGSIIGYNAAGQFQRAQTAGTLVLAGLADRDYDNTASAAPSPISIVAERGCWNLPFAAAPTPANVGAAVYAVDDGGVTLTNSGSLLAVGAVDGLELLPSGAAVPYVLISRS